jgi:formylglycine-generating enzyme required for sulfatase activity
LLPIVLILFFSPLRTWGVTIQTVSVGNAGNADDTEVMNDGTTGYGSVDYVYRIGMTEITNAQYVEFLNAVAKTDTYELFSPVLDTWHGITRSGSPGSYVYSVKPDAIGEGFGGTDYTYGDKPVSLVSWYDALRFANWLHNGQPTGLQDASTTEDGAYAFSGATSVGPRNAGAIWFLPSEDEWYKAAYYDGGSATYFNYATGSDTKPNNNFPTFDTGNSANWGDATGNVDYPMTDVGAYTLSQSPYGTFDQAGNVAEWTENLGTGAFRTMRGGESSTALGVTLHANWRTSANPIGEFPGGGFRVATVPEPSAVVLAIIGIVGVAGAAWRASTIRTPTVHRGGAKSWS